jgi:hypothetical protein
MPGRRSTEQFGQALQALMLPQSSERSFMLSLLYCIGLLGAAPFEGCAKSAGVGFSLNAPAD